MAVNERTYFGFKRTRGDASRVDSASKGVPALIVPVSDRDLHVASAADEATDWNVANPTHPTLYIHSETTPATNYGTLVHNATDFVITAGTGGLRLTGAVLVTTSMEVEDDILLTLGSDNDGVLLNRSTALNADTALTGVIVGTPVVAAIPANSLVIGNKTADGDIVLVGQTGGNTTEGLRFDTSANLVVVNEGSADVDFRVESNGSANALVIDGGTDTMAVFSAVTASVELTIGTLTANVTPALAGNVVRVTTGTVTDNATAMSGTATGFAALGIAAPTLAATNTSVTTTDVATLYVNAAPTAGTNQTFTRSYSLLLDGGQFRVDSNVQVNNTAAFASTQPTAAVVLQSGTAPAGAIVTGGALFTDGTTIKKIIADGTVSDVQT